MKQDLMGKCNIKTSNLAWFYNQDVLDLWGKKYYLYTTFPNGDKLFCTKDDWNDDVIVRKPRAKGRKTERGEIMAKNLIPEIAKMLGVEIGEEFKIGGSELRYRFTMKNLESYCEGYSWGLCHSDSLVNLIEGRCEVIKLPWRPQCGDEYWSYIGENFVVCWRIWSETPEHLAMLKCGCVFRTKEEALKAKPRLYKELTGKDWGGET